METAANRNRGELIRKFLLQNVDAHPATITSIATKKFKVDERNIRQHIQRLRTQGLLLAEGKTRDRVYKLRVLKEWNKMYPIAPGTTEDAAWREISPEIGRLPKDVMDIWDRGFTEMFNNALDHSGGTEIDVRFRKTAINTELALYDNGVGIFKKIQNALNLPDQREAIFELSKGKFTTDPTKHSGEGIFFTSRLFDSYDILSGGLAFMREAGHDEHWVLDRNRFE